MKFFTNAKDTNWDSTILFVGHLFHDCDRTFGPGLRQTETNECAKRIPDRTATTSNCTPPPLPISFSSSGFFSSSLCPHLVLFFLVTSCTPFCQYFYPRLFTLLSVDAWRLSTCTNHRFLHQSRSLLKVLNIMRNLHASDLEELLG